MVNQKYLKTSLSPNKVLIRSFTEIIEFDNVKFHKSISFKDGVWREFIEIGSNSNFSKNKFFKLWIFLVFFSVSYNNVVITKKIYFSPTFLKLWVHISGNFAAVVGGPQYYRRDVNIGKKKGVFSPVQ